MLLGNTEGLTVHTGLLIHVDGFLSFFGVDEALLSLDKVASVKLELGLVQENLVDGLWVVLTGNLQGRVPILLVLVHVDGLLGLVSFDELLLGFLESILILKVKSILQVNLWHLILSVMFSQVKGLLESLLVSFEVNSSLNKTILDKELCTLLSAHVLGNLDSDLTELLLGSVGLCHSKSFLPQVTSSVHVDGV